MSYPHKPPLDDRTTAFERGVERYFRRAGQPRSVRLERPRPGSDRAAGAAERERRQSPADQRDALVEDTDAAAAGRAGDDDRVEDLS